MGSLAVFGAVANAWPRNCEYRDARHSRGAGRTFADSYTSCQRALQRRVERFRGHGSGFNHGPPKRRRTETHFGGEPSGSPIFLFGAVKPSVVWQNRLLPPLTTRR